MILNAIPIAAFADWDRAFSGPEGANDSILLIAADARLDNREELNAALGMAAAAAPEQTLVSAFRVWGDSFAEKLNGDFAVVFWDGRSRRVVAARDPFGVRPLYFRSTAKGCWFASDAGWILGASDATSALNDERVVEYLLGRYHATDATFFRDIRELTPGHTLVVDRSGARLHRYWQPPLRLLPANTPTEDLNREFRRLFIQSVRRRLRSAGPVAIHVSGGLDSSSIAAAADVVSRRGERPSPGLLGVAGVYPGLVCDESEFIAAVARHVGFPIHQWDASEADAIDLIDPAISEPGVRIVQRGGTAGDIAIARAHGSSVILCGIGGDEIGIVAGVVKDMIADGELSQAAEEIFAFEGATTRGRVRRLRQLARQYAPPSIVRAYDRTRFRPPGWLAPGVMALARSVGVPASPPQQAFASHVQASVWQRLTSAQTARAIGKMQTHALGFGLEYRFPFLDHDFVQFVLSIPYPLWPRPGMSSRLHREPLREILPPAVADRHGKAEFTAAAANRLRRTWSKVQDVMTEGRWVSASYVDRKGAHRLFNSLGSEGSALASDWGQMWAIVSLEAWLRKASGLKSTRLGEGT